MKNGNEQSQHSQQSRLSCITNYDPPPKLTAASDWSGPRPGRSERKPAGTNPRPRTRSGFGQASPADGASMRHLRPLLIETRAASQSYKKKLFIGRVRGGWFSFKTIGAFNKGAIRGQTQVPLITLIEDLLF